MVKQLYMFSKPEMQSCGETPGFYCCPKFWLSGLIFLPDVLTWKTSLGNYRVIFSRLGTVNLSTVTFLKKQTKSPLKSIWGKKIMPGKPNRNSFGVSTLSQVVQIAYIPLVQGIVWLPHTTSYIHQFQCVWTSRELEKFYEERGGHWTQKQGD